MVPDSEAANLADCFSQSATKLPKKILFRIRFVVLPQSAIGLLTFAFDRLSCVLPIGEAKGFAKFRSVSNIRAKAALCCCKEEEKIAKVLSPPPVKSLCQEEATLLGTLWSSATRTGSFLVRFLGYGTPKRVSESTLYLCFSLELTPPRFPGKRRARSSPCRASERASGSRLFDKSFASCWFCLCSLKLCQS